MSNSLPHAVGATALRARPSGAALRLLLALLLAAALAGLTGLKAFVAGAASQDDDDVVRVEADLVVLNATVTDAEGRYVHKLRRDDFRVFEDGREQPISLFSVEETPFAAAILLDTSGSMEGRLSLARAAAIRFLDGLRETDVAAVYHFGAEVEQLQDFSPGRDLPPLAYGLSSKGMTALNDAVVRAARDLAARPEKRRAIVVLSDGADTKSAATTERALDEALKVNAVIFTVNMADPRTDPRDRLPATGALKLFAEKSGGRYVSTPGGRALSEAFQGIVQELSNQYTIGYRPTNRARDGRWRSVEVKVSRQEAKARTRSGYRAAKS
jgi:Ca-activated chloride channel family protein